MIDRAYTGFKNLKRNLIGAISGTKNVVYSESVFYNPGYMRSRTEYLKRRISDVNSTILASAEMNQENLTGDYKWRLKQEHDSLLFELVFLMSNSFSNLDNCIKLIGEYDFEFKICVEALICYKNGDEKEATRLFKDYYERYGGVSDHYLVNKVMGTLIYKNGEYDKAIPFLSYSLGFVPYDEELLMMLEDCFLHTERTTEKRIIEQIHGLLKKEN